MRVVLKWLVNCDMTFAFPYARIMSLWTIWDARPIYFLKANPAFLLWHKLGGRRVRQSSWRCNGCASSSTGAQASLDFGLCSNSTTNHNNDNYDNNDDIISPAHGLIPNKTPTRTPTRHVWSLGVGSMMDDNDDDDNDSRDVFLNETTRTKDVEIIYAT